MRRLLLTLVGSLWALGLWAPPALAQNDITESREWDADASSFTYCVELGRSGGATGGTARGADYETPRVAAFKIKTAGADTAVISNTASSGALKFVSAGDVISFIVDGQRQERAVKSKSSDNAIVVDDNIDLTGGYYYSFRHQSCGTAGTSGEIPVRDLKYWQLSVQVEQMNVASGGVDIQIECRHKYGDFWTLEAKNITAGGTGVDSFLTRFFHEERWEACRVGVKVSDDDVVDTTTAAEKINIFLSGDGVGQE